MEHHVGANLIMGHIKNNEDKMTNNIIIQRVIEYKTIFLDKKKYHSIQEASNIKT